MTSAWFGVLVFGTGCMYGSGSFAYYGLPFPGAHVNLGGCLDLGVSQATDEGAGGDGQIVRYSIGNRCWHAVTVDLASIRALSMETDGVRRPLRAFDPHHEIQALPITARWMGAEEIQYLPVGRGLEPASICVDVGGVDASVPRSEHWVCMQTHDTSIGPLL
jgi:hypothetical protein